MEVSNRNDRKLQYKLKIKTQYQFIDQQCTHYNCSTKEILLLQIHHQFNELYLNNSTNSLNSTLIINTPPSHPLDTESQATWDYK